MASECYDPWGAWPLGGPKIRKIDCPRTPLTPFKGRNTKLSVLITL